MQVAVASCRQEYAGTGRGGGLVSRYRWTIYMSTDDARTALKELDQWRELCRTLVALGAVTREDLKAGQADSSTPGRRLLIDIRTWGESFALIRINAFAYNLIAEYEQKLTEHAAGPEGGAA